VPQSFPPPFSSRHPTLFSPRAFRAIIPINYRAKLLCICPDHWGRISPGVSLSL